MTSRLSLIVLGLLVLLPLISAHEHGGPMVVYDGSSSFRNDLPMDNTLKLHIAIQTLSWGILFPFGMVMGINRSKYHVPFQSITILCTLFASYLAHHHQGREFYETAHSTASKYLFWYLISQTILGIFLKTHLGQQKSFRKVAVVIHGIIGKSFPIVGWSQIVLGAIASLGFCFGDHTGQCVAHFVMGSSFILYGLLLLVILRIGGPFLLRRGWSQEAIDSYVIMFFGIITTFTMHNFMGSTKIAWSHKDLQHTSLGVMWWSGGALGAFLARNGKRNIVPSLIIMMTGWAMSSHAQELEFSTKIHQVFGFALISAGFARLIEVCFVVSPVNSTSATPLSVPIKVFQHLPPYLLVLSGLTFMSSTEEQVAWTASTGIDHVTYANGLFSGAFIIYLLGIGLLEFYSLTRPKSKEELLNQDEVRRVEEGASHNNSTGWIRNFSFLRSSNVEGRNDGRQESYEAIPLDNSPRNGSSEGSATSSETRVNGERDVRGETVFDLGEDDEDDGLNDSYYKEKS